MTVVEQLLCIVPICISLDKGEHKDEIRGRKEATIEFKNFKVGQHVALEGEIREGITNIVLGQVKVDQSLDGDQNLEVSRTKMTSSQIQI